VVGESVDFIDAKFAGGVSFSYCETSVGYFHGAEFGPTARFYNMTISGDLELDGVSADGTLQLRYSTINGNCYLTKVEKLGGLNLRDLSIKGTFYLGGSTFPSEHTYIDRLSYGSIVPFREALELISTAEYSASNYSHLESYLRKEGQLEEAKKVGEAWASSQRGLMKWYSFSYWWSLFLWLFVDNGFSPERALFIGVIIVCFGTVVFWKKDNMTEKDPSKPAPYYHSFLYSLDLFVPAISLGMAEYWIPKNTDWRRSAWLYTHRILGWIIVPIGLLALAGMVKPPGG
jgi:hypothetical protein